ncbi:MAG: pantoate--beta-alanine ligase, partial [Pseudomonadota bacterium]
TDLSMNVKIYGVETERADDGLALSSRNGYLTSEQRSIAPVLYQQISALADSLEAGRQDYSVLIRETKQGLVDAGFKVDYVELRAADSLLPPSHEDTSLVVLAAAFLGKTRLIDNYEINL